MSYQKPENEKEKRAERFSYTMNHALACTLTDGAEPYLDYYFQRYLGMKFPLGCGVDHGHTHEDGHTCQHHHHHGNQMWKWYLGEIAGDFGAVAVTVGAHRFMPGVMDQVGKWMEPIAAPLFHFGANLSANRWAKNEGVDKNSPEVKEKAEEIYSHEISQLPQALLWTASSIAINLGVQRALGNRGAFAHMAGAKAMGASLNSLLVVGARAFMPSTARKWDQFTDRNLVKPVSRAFGKMAGFSEKELEAIADTSHSHSWADRFDNSSHNKEKALAMR